MGSGDEGRLREVVTTVTAAAGYDLEELVIRSAGRRSVVRVVVDADGGVTLDAAAEISRAISEELDAAGADDPTGSQPYTLEVTSPGIGRPLTEARHFRRARTRLVALVTTDGRAITGHVLGVTDSGVELVLSGRKGISQTQVPFNEITRAKVEVEFSSPPAAVLALLGIDPTPEPELVEDGQETDEDDEDDADTDTNEPDDDQTDSASTEPNDQEDKDPDADTGGPNDEDEAGKRRAASEGVKS